jgi:hypothetical protein
MKKLMLLVAMYSVAQSSEPSGPVPKNKKLDCIGVGILPTWMTCKFTAMDDDSVLISVFVVQAGHAGEVKKAIEPIAYWSERICSKGVPNTIALYIEGYPTVGRIARGVPGCAETVLTDLKIGG